MLWHIRKLFDPTFFSKGVEEVHRSGSMLIRHRGRTGGSVVDGVGTEAHAGEVETIPITQTGGMSTRARVPHPHQMLVHRKWGHRKWGHRKWGPRKWGPRKWSPRMWGHKMWDHKTHDIRHLPCRVRGTGVLVVSIASLINLHAMCLLLMINLHCWTVWQYFKTFQTFQTVNISIHWIALYSSVIWLIYIYRLLWLVQFIMYQFFW